MYRLLILLLALALAACTGSYEPPAPSFLAVASGQRIDFYLNTRLRPDVRDDGQSPLIGSWTSLSLPVLDLYFKLKQSDQQNNRLWVLDREKLTAYSTDPFFEDLVPDPTTLDPRSFPFTDGNSQPVDCSQGYLSASPRYLLVVCPPPSSGAPYSLYLVDFNLLQAGGVPQTLIGPISVQASQAVFTLTTSNALVILNGASSSMEYHPDPQMPANETGVIRGGSYIQPLYTPQDLTYDSAGNRVFALLRSSTDVRLLTWNLKADTPSDVSEPDPNGRNPDQLQTSSANIYALSSQQGLFRVQFSSGTLRLLDPPGDLNLDVLSYLGSTVEDGRLLYLAAEDPGASAEQKSLIVVLNSQKPLENLLSSDVKINSNSSAPRVNPFSRPVSLSIFPVQER